MTEPGLNGLKQKVPYCSVVIPVYNGSKHLEACLQALADQSAAPESYEVIVVEDGTTDNAHRLAQQYAVHLVRQPHEGPAAARNRGLAAARGELVLFTDADCAPAPGWIESMCAAFQNQEVVGAKGVYGTRQPGLVARFVQLEYEDKYRGMHDRRAIDFVDTYSAGYRRHVLLAAGGFDTRFPTASVEDQELSFRLAKAGHRLVFQPEAVVYHQHPVTWWAYARRKFRIGFWKVLVHLRHPDKLVRDSHTPQVLKLQMLLSGLLLGALLAVLAWPGLWPLPVAVGLLLVASMIPFCLRAWQRDRPVVWVAPCLLATRSFALGLGFAAGLLKVALAADKRDKLQ